MMQPYDLSLEELRKYKPDLTRQPDFMEFWESNKLELAKIPLKYELAAYDYPAKAKVRGSHLPIWRKHRRMVAVPMHPGNTRARAVPRIQLGI